MLKRFTLFFAVITLLLGIFFYKVRGNETRIVKEQLMLSEMTHIKVQERLLTSFFISHLADVEIISKLHELKNFAVTENSYSLHSLQLDFLAFFNKKGDYDKIRFLDKNGIEKICVNLKDGKPLLVPKRDLQDKHNRYYFQNIKQLKPGKIYPSPLDLNIENHEIERPFKPTLRIGVPIFDQYADFSGALVVNYLAASMLRAFRDNGRDSAGGLSLLNHAGFWLSAENLDDEWGFMVAGHRAANFGQRFPAAWKKIIAGGNGQFDDDAGIFTFSTFSPKNLMRGGTSGSYGYKAAGFKVDKIPVSYPWKIVSMITAAQLQGILAQKLKGKETLWRGFFGLLFLLSGSLLWIFLQSRQKERDQQERIVEINASLETKIEARTRELNESNKKLSTIIKTTSQGFIMVDGKARVTEINPAMLVMIGRSQEEVMGRSWFDLIGDDNRELLREKLTIRGRGISEEYEMKIPRPDGSLCSCRFSATPLLNSANKVEGSFALVSDIGEQLEFQQNLEKAKFAAERNSAAKTLFLSSMSHEFRTPMNSILGFAQLLDDETSLSQKQKYFVEKILVSGDHLKKLIDDILDLARIEAGGAEINIVNVDLCTTMHELIAIIKPLAEEREIDFLAEEPETLYQVKVDPLRLQQIILNLLSNAIKYNRIGGRVEVSCDKINDRQLRLHIVDDGPGFLRINSLFSLNRLIV